MLIPEWADRAVLATSAGLVVVAGLSLARALRRGRRGRARWLPLGLIVVAFAAGFFAWNLPRAVVVRDRLGGLEVEDQRALGSPDLPAPPGADCRPRSTWVVNRTTRNLRVLEVQYGEGLGLPPGAPLVIPPGTACSTHELDYIGPRDKPPARAPLQGDEARLHAGERTWLTWD